MNLVIKKSNQNFYRRITHMNLKNIKLLLTLSLVTSLHSLLAVDSGHIYNRAHQTVAAGSAVTFDHGNALSGPTHTPGSAEIVIATTGTYYIIFTVTTLTICQFALYKNGIRQESTKQGSVSGDLVAPVLLNLTAGDVLTLVNHSGVSITLPSNAGAPLSSSTNASVVLMRI